MDAEKSFPKYQYSRFEDDNSPYLLHYDKLKDVFDTDDQVVEVGTYKLVSVKNMVRKSVVEDAPEE